MQLEWRRIPQPGDGYLLLCWPVIWRRRSRPCSSSGSFLNQLAHELNTPLAIVSGSLKQLGKKALDSAKLPRERLQQAQQETNRLVRLLRNLLVLSDLETGRRQLQLQPVDLQGWLQHWRDQQDLPEDVQLTVLPAVGEDALLPSMLRRWLRCWRNCSITACVTANQRRLWCGSVARKGRWRCFGKTMA